MDFFDGARADDDMLWIANAADEIDALNNCDPVSVPVADVVSGVGCADYVEHALAETDIQRQSLYTHLYQDGGDSEM